MASTDDAPDLPLLFEVYEIARLVGWGRRRMQRLLQKDLKIATKLGNRWVVTRHDLRAEFRSAYEELLRRREAGEVAPLQRGRRQRVTTTG